MRMVTDLARPPSTETRAFISPARVSRPISVVGSDTFTIPVSTRTVAIAMVQWPHMGT